MYALDIGANEIGLECFNGTGVEQNLNHIFPQRIIKHNYICLSELHLNENSYHITVTESDSKVDGT